MDFLNNLTEKGVLPTFTGPTVVALVGLVLNDANVISDSTFIIACVTSLSGNVIAGVRAWALSWRDEVDNPAS